MVTPGRPGVGGLSMDLELLEALKKRALQIVRRSRDPVRCLEVMRAKAASVLDSGGHGAICKRELAVEESLSSSRMESPVSYVHDRGSAPIFVGGQAIAEVFVSASLPVDDQATEEDHSESIGFCPAVEGSFLGSVSVQCMVSVRSLMAGCLYVCVQTGDDLHVSQGFDLLAETIGDAARLMEVEQIKLQTTVCAPIFSSDPGVLLVVTSSGLKTSNDSRGDQTGGMQNMYVVCGRFAGRGGETPNVDGDLWDESDQEIYKDAKKSDLNRKMLPVSVVDDSVVLQTGVVARTLTVSKRTKKGNEDVTADKIPLAGSLAERRRGQ